MKGVRLTAAHARHPDTGLPDGFHGFPAGVCPWCSGPPNERGERFGEEGCDPQWYIRHGGPCPRVAVLDLNAHGGIHRLVLKSQPFVKLGDL